MNSQLALKSEVSSSFLNKMNRPDNLLDGRWPDEVVRTVVAAGQVLVEAERYTPKGKLTLLLTTSSNGDFRGANWVLNTYNGLQATYNLFADYSELTLQIKDEEKCFDALYDDEGQVSSIHPIPLPPMIWRRNLKAVSTQEIPGHRQIYFNGSGWMVSILTGETGKASEIGWDQIFAVDGYSAWFSRCDEENDSKILLHQSKSGLKRVTEFPQTVDYEALRELVEGKVNWYKICQMYPADSWLEGKIKSNPAGENLGNHGENQRRAQIVSLPAAREKRGII